MCVCFINASSLWPVTRATISPHLLGLSPSMRVTWGKQTFLIVVDCSSLWPLLMIWIQFRKVGLHSQPAHHPHDPKSHEINRQQIVLFLTVPSTCRIVPFKGRDTKLLTILSRTILNVAKGGPSLWPWINIFLLSFIIKRNEWQWTGLIVHAFLLWELLWGTL